MTTKKPIPPPQPAAPPAPRREHFREAPAAIVARIEGHLHDDRPGHWLRAVLAAYDCGYRLDESDIIADATNTAASIADTGRAARYRIRNADKIRDEAAALARIRLLAASPFGRTTREEARGAREQAIREEAAKRTVAVNARISQLRDERAKRELEALQKQAERDLGGAA